MTSKADFDCDYLFLYILKSIAMAMLFVVNVVK